MVIDAAMLGPGRSSTSTRVANSAQPVSPKKMWICWPGWSLTCDRIPTWKCLINCPLGTNERISLIADIFSDHNETEMAKRLCGSDAQSFVDVAVEVLCHSFIPEEWPLTQTFHAE